MLELLRIYPRIHPWVYSWTYPRAYRLTYPRGLSLDPVRFQLLPLWPWRGHTPECGGFATLKAIILTRTHCAVLKRY